MANRRSRAAFCGVVATLLIALLSSLFIVGAAAEPGALRPQHLETP